MHRALPRPVLAAAIVPLVMIVGLQSAWAAFACRADGVVRERCCCPAQPRDDRGPVDGEARIQAQGCCAVSVHAAPDAPIARTVDRDPVDAFVAVVPVVTAPVAAPLVARAPDLATLARPPPRAALYLDKHALLR